MCINAHRKRLCSSTCYFPRPITIGPCHARPHETISRWAVPFSSFSRRRRLTIFSLHLLCCCCCGCGATHKQETRNCKNGYVSLFFVLSIGGYDQLLLLLFCYDEHRQHHHRKKIKKKKFVDDDDGGDTIVCVVALL